MKQLSLCPEYSAPRADYRVIELPLERPHELGSGRQVARKTHYDDAANAARNHCVLAGREVWVLDANDGNQVVLRVEPAEYTAQALITRLHQRPSQPALAD